MVKALFQIQNSPCEFSRQSLEFQTQFNFLSLRREIEENKGKMSDQNQQPIPGCNIFRRVARRVFCHCACINRPGEECVCRTRDYCLCAPDDPTHRVMASTRVQTIPIYCRCACTNRPGPECRCHPGLYCCCVLKDPL